MLDWKFSNFTLLLGHFTLDCKTCNMILICLTLLLLPNFLVMDICGQLFYGLPLSKQIRIN